MSPLPVDNSAWPPAGHHERLQRMRLHSAWYAGDPERLRAAHGSTGVQTVGGLGTTLNPTPGLATRVMAAIRNEFWGADITDEADTRRHLPTPQDVATISSEVLFSEPLQIRVMGPTHDADGTLQADGTYAWRKGDPTPDTARAQQRLEEVLAGCGFHSTLLAAAEISSALGSTGLRIAYDKSVPALANRPLIARVDADAVIPLYTWGQLTGTMFWRVVLQDKGDVVWRHIELHEGGRAYHALYKGDSNSIGTRRSLAELDATKHLALIVDSEGSVMVNPKGGPTALSVPNILPDPLDRASNAGRSDYTPPVLDLFDAIDRIYSQMMDTIDDAKSRLIIADSMLEKKGAGKGVGFNPDQRVFQRVKVPPAEKEGGGLPIEKIQFDMHVAEYLEAIDALTGKAIRAAGYNAQTMGDESGQEMTATEYSGRNKRSMSTRDKKIGYWQPALSALLTSLLEVDVHHFAPVGEDGQRVKAYPVEVKFPDAIQPTIGELANTVKTLKEAESASKFIRVRVLHPDWTEREVQEEVDRMLEESSVVDPITFGTGGAGVGAGDGI